MLSTISNINLMRKSAAAPPPTETPATYWLAFGPGTGRIQKITPNPQISNWSSTSPTTNLFTSYGFNGATNGTGTWIATGSGTNTLAKSTDDGNTWTPISGAFSASGFKVAYGNNMFVASGGSGSSNGVNIITLDSTGSITNTYSGYFATYAWSANYIKGLWYVGGTGGGSTSGFTTTNALVVSSSNAATSWSKSSQNGIPSITGDGAINASISDISTDGTLIIMSGLGYLDNSNGNRVSTTRSTNGTNWTTCLIVAPSLFNNGSQSAYGNGVWIAVGVPATAGNCIARSTNNGTTWSYVGNGILGNGYGIAYGGNSTWVAVGSKATSGQNSAISTDNGATWTARGFPINESTDIIYGISSNYKP